MTVKAKARKLFRLLAREPQLSEHERWLHARSFAATPRERWEMNEQFILSLPSSALSKLKRSASKSSA